jgi:carboxymethylenebutenolidase
LGKTLSLTASDGHRLGAYRADPAGAPQAGIVVIQEIFGVNHHIRSVCDRFAAEGYAAVAPALFDRIQPDYQSGYSPEEIERSRKFVANPDWDAMLRDTQAAIAEVKSAGPVAIMGSAWAGRLRFSPPRGSTAFMHRSAITVGGSRRSPTRSRAARPNCISARRIRASR